MPPISSCLKIGPFYSEVTRAFCRVPSTSFSQAPWYVLPSYLCRFLVRSISYGYFQGLLHCIFNPIRKYNLHNPSTHSRYRNINLFPIDYAFLPRLRSRLTLRRLTLRKETLDFRRMGFSPILSLLMSAFSLLIPPANLTVHLQRLTERSPTSQ